MHKEHDKEQASNGMSPSSRVDDKLQLVESFAPTTNMEDFLEWLPFNPVKNWRPQSPDEDNPSKTICTDRISSWFPTDDKVVFYDPPTAERVRTPLTYAGLQQEINRCPNFWLDQYHQDLDTKNSTVVAVLLPPCMMAENAVVLVAVLAQTGVAVAPLDPAMPPFKLKVALKQLNCDALITTSKIIEQSVKQDEHKEIFDQMKLVYTVQPSETTVGAPRWALQKREGRDEGIGKKAGKHIQREGEPALLLRTSGTTSTPKIVPLSRANLLYNALSLAASLELERKDVGCNAMPLHHIGGIASALLSVIVSGSSIVMTGSNFSSEKFLDCIATTKMARSNGTPTWYHAVPSMHKALLLAAKARLLTSQAACIPNALRFIRSGAAYLSPDTAYELSRIMGGCPVIPTYSMSECMPICSALHSPIIASANTAKTTGELSVGLPVSCDLAIVNNKGEILPYGTTGEVGLRGGGVMSRYQGISTTESHARGWFLTGDAGTLDRNGNLTLTGRLKEMIKRGGEQVWPTEIDKVVERVEGVQVAVAFGVPNPLWGEEVAVAIVKSPAVVREHDLLKQEILEACRQELDASAIPSQIIVVDSTNLLLKGSTGKYLRTKMAEHLGVQAVDIASYNALEMMANASTQKAVRGPSTALNGLRLLVGLFVVQLHIGLYPNIAWLKVQSFAFNMIIFFLLGAFQLVCSTRTTDLVWSQFVGTKIGTMHALFILTQIIALPSFLLHMCGSEGFKETFEDESCTEDLPLLLPAFIAQTITGLGLGIGQGYGRVNVNITSWFQSAFYIFLMLFPWLNKRLRSASSRRLSWVFGINMVIASAAFVPILFFIQGFTKLHFSILSWLPTLVCGMIAGYSFMRSSASRGDVVPFFQNPNVWGLITDTLSIVFLLLEVANVLTPNCVYVREETFHAMRPGQELPSKTFVSTFDGTLYYFACSVSYDEFVEYVHSDENDRLMQGRWTTEMGAFISYGRLATPLLVMWIYGMAHGRGWTVRFLNTWVLQKLAHLAYPLYLLHVPIGRYYWYFTHGPSAEFWFEIAAGYPIPVEWYEVVAIIAICLGIGHLMDRYLVQHLSGYTTKYAVGTCQWIEKRFLQIFKSTESKVLSSFSAEENGDDDYDGNDHLVVLQRVLTGLTGSTVLDKSTDLAELGLDSLGVTALLGILKANIPAARHLGVGRLVTMATVGDLVDYLQQVDPPKYCSAISADESV